MRATANEGTNTQTRTFGANAFCDQGGAEVLGRFGFGDAANRVANEALELPGALLSGGRLLRGGISGRCGAESAVFRPEFPALLHGLTHATRSGSGA